MTLSGESKVLTGEASVVEALRRIQRGEMVLVSDGADREDEADLTMAAQWVTPEAIAFMLRHGRGLVCMPCEGARLDRLGIGAMVTEAGCDTAFTVSIDHHSVGSGISAVDRAATIRAILDPWAGGADFVRPGHVFPLRARDGGVLVRTGHTEAAVDLARMAGLAPCAVICEVLNDDGTIARGPELDRLAADQGLARVTIDDLVAYRRSVLRPGVRVSLVT
ncbi:MAG: 3,4-dihydroxy 2-butanone 4-phosphate synthase / cyclohydrolase [Actinomycetota bacterium]|nr:3,4-dihydroxy 2-butanone 4-phosphate synthase / cyclohydrolase [Actinomycetota bacterium]